MTDVPSTSQTDATAQRIGSAIAALDYVRRSPARVGGSADHKEWQHFAILAPGIDLLVNFSCCDTAGAAQVEGSELPRIVLLARGEDWDGDVETFFADDVTITGGRIDMRFARNRLLFRDGFYEITAALSGRPVAVDLRLAPLTMPAFVPSVPMLDGPPLHWAVVPRLLVTGTLRLGGRTYCLDGAPAYHDHNWGHFLWGHDVSWEWGFVLPDDPCEAWCLTFVRLTNRARTLALAHKLLLWKRERLVQVFREGELESRAELAYLQPRRIFKVPRAMALLAPGLAADVPNAITTRGRAGGDWVECRCEMEHLAQVLIPSEPELGVTIFNEACARSTVRGCVGGERVEFAGRSILEFIRYV